MKAYFASLPGKTSVKLAHDTNFDTIARISATVTHDLSEYHPASLRFAAPEPSGMMKPVNVEDIEAALSEMLPLVCSFLPSLDTGVNNFLSADFCFRLLVRRTLQLLFLD